MLKIKPVFFYIKLTRNGVTVSGLCCPQNRTWKSEIRPVVMILHQARNNANKWTLHGCITFTCIHKELFFLNLYSGIAYISRRGWDIKARNTSKMKLLLFIVMLCVQPTNKLLDIIILLQGAPGTPLQHLSVVALVTSPWDLCWFVLWFCFLCLRITSRYTIIAEAFDMQFLILKVNYPIELPTDFKVCCKLQSLCRLCWEF